MNWIFVVLIVIVLFIKILVDQEKFKKYKRRESSENEWKIFYSDCFDIASGVLEIVCEAFLFNVKYKYNFRPGEKIVEIYEDTTSKWCDDMQYEILVKEIKERYGVEIKDEDILNIKTLGDLVRYVEKNKKC